MSDNFPSSAWLPDDAPSEELTEEQYSEWAGWVEPTDRGSVAEYWLTRRRADGGLGPNVRVKYRWAPSESAWISGTRNDRQGRPDAVLSCLHSNNGWRIDADQSDPDDARDAREELSHAP
jgi:hypothetical protein